MKWYAFKYISQILHASLVFACMAVNLCMEDLQRALHTFQSGQYLGKMLVYKQGQIQSWTLGGAGVIQNLTLGGHVSFSCKKFVNSLL